MDYPPKLTELPIGGRLFSPGDIVVWSEELASDSCNPAKRLGNGPFTVHEVFAVPTTCTMAGTYCRDGDHHPECGAHIITGVGHPQWVTIRLPDGSVAQDPEGSSDSRFSGAWFVRA